MNKIEKYLYAHRLEELLAVSCYTEDSTFSLLDQTGGVLSYFIESFSESIPFKARLDMANKMLLPATYILGHIRRLQALSNSSNEYTPLGALKIVNFINSIYKENPNSEEELDILLSPESAGLPYTHTFLFQDIKEKFLDKNYLSFRDILSLDSTEQSESFRDFIAKSVEAPPPDANVKVYVPDDDFYRLFLLLYTVTLAWDDSSPRVKEVLGFISGMDKAASIFVMYSKMQGSMSMDLFGKKVQFKVELEGKAKSASERAARDVLTKIRESNKLSAKKSTSMYAGDVTRDFMKVIYSFYREVVGSYPTKGDSEVLIGVITNTFNVYDLVTTQAITERVIHSIATKYDKGIAAQALEGVSVRIFCDNFIGEDVGTRNLRYKTYWISSLWKDFIYNRTRLLSSTGVKISYKRKVTGDKISEYLIYAREVSVKKKNFMQIYWELEKANPPIKGYLELDMDAERLNISTFLSEQDVDVLECVLQTSTEGLFMNTLGNMGIADKGYVEDFVASTSIKVEFPKENFFSQSSTLTKSYTGQDKHGTRSEEDFTVVEKPLDSYVRRLPANSKCSEGAKEYAKQKSIHLPKGYTIVQEHTRQIMRKKDSYITSSEAMSQKWSKSSLKNTTGDEDKELRF